MTFKQFTWAAVIGASVALAGAALPAQAAKKPPVASVITVPSAGASVSSPVTVSFSLENPDAAAAAPANGSSWPVTAPAAGPRHLPQAYLVIDAPTPQAGSTLQADADHVAFPAGQAELSVPLATGPHQLQVVFVNRKGMVTRHFQPSEPVSISVH